MDADIQPEIATIWNEAKAYIEQGRFDEAIEIYKYVLLRYEDDPVAVEYASAYLGDVFLTLKQLKLAEGHIKKAINYSPEKPEYHHLLGFVYSLQRRWGKAVKEFEVSVKAKPDDAEYLRGLGWACFNAGDKPKGLVYLNNAAKIAPSNVNILLDLASAYLGMLDFDRAERHARKALLIDPGSKLAQEVVGKIEEFRKMYRRVRSRRK